MHIKYSAIKRGWKLRFRSVRAHVHAKALGAVVSAIVLNGAIVPEQVGLERDRHRTLP